MKLTLMFVVGLALCSNSFAAEKKKAPAKKDDVVFAQSPSSGHVGTTKIGVSGPISLIDGEIFWGPYFDVLHEIYPNLWIGGETGFQYWSDSQGGASANVWIIPILPTGIYHFDISETPTFSPFVGLSLGIAIVHGSISLGALSASDTEADFEGFLHLGATFGEEKHLFGDIRLGVIDGEFLFSPGVGWYF